MQTQAEIDAANQQYWEHICGSVQAVQMGFRGSEAETIRKYDDWFFGYYPYVDRFIPFTEIVGKDVLEVGLGYGSVSQRLAERGAKFTGLDIAAGPVNWANHRLAINDLPGKAVQGSVLNAPFPDESFDYVVTIGCLHHTGNMQRGIDEVYRVLRKGGRATIMTYNATSYHRWYVDWMGTLRYVNDVMLRGSREPLPLDQDGRASFDFDAKGNAAPETVTVTKTSLHRMLSAFSRDKIHRTNIGDHGLLAKFPREGRLRYFGPSFGLDLYAMVQK